MRGKRKQPSFQGRSWHNGQYLVSSIISQTYFAALVSDTPSIWIKLVPGVVLRFPRW